MNTLQSQAQAMADRAPALTEQDLREFNGLFPAYIFRRRRTREIWTSCCGSRGGLPPESELMAAAHTPEPRDHFGCSMGIWSAPPKSAPIPMACPFCGRVSPVKELGRTGRRDNLWTFRRAVVLKWFRGALWAVCCDLIKSYKTEDLLTAGPQVNVLAVYRFAPGRVEYCRRHWASKTWTAYDLIQTAGLRPGYKLPEPFPFCAKYGLGYDLLGADAVNQSPFRWCGADAYFRHGASPLRYLALCTAYPRQVEMLIKAGLLTAVEDFVSRSKRNAAAFDWYDPDPFHGLGLTKSELSEFMAGSRDLAVLARYKSLARAGVSASLTELGQLRQVLGPVWFERVCAKMRQHRLSAKRLTSYLARAQEEARGKKKRGPLISSIAEWWCDYIDAAQGLGYDLRNDIFLLPRDLKGHHDKATKTWTVVQEARRKDEAKAAERRRLKQLVPRYTYSDGRWLIRPPVNAAEIVAEGQALKHCVGGYASRHLNGRTTILFLRDRQRPGRPLVTIEIHGAEIIQIHGWDNELTACKDNPKRRDPRELYRDFLDGWLAWVAAGSPRDKTGRPKTPEEKPTKKAGAA